MLTATTVLLAAINPMSHRSSTFTYPFGGQPIAIHYKCWHASGEPVLLLHGLADCNVVWSSLGEVLGDRYCVVAPDLRGHGDSDKPERGYDSDAIISDLRALMKHLGWVKAHILGHSWAGRVACLWAARHPEDFASSILVDPFFAGSIPSWFRAAFPLFYRLLPFLKTAGPFPSYAAAEELGRSLKQFRGWSPLQQAAFASAIEQKADGQWGSKFALAARDGIFEDLVRDRGLTDAVVVPSLLIRPERGLNRFAWQLRPYYDYFADLQVVAVPGNHWAFLSDPEPFDRTVKQFLDTRPIAANGSRPDAM